MYGKIVGTGLYGKQCSVFCNVIGKIVGEDDTYYKLILPSGVAVYVRKENVEVIPTPSKINTVSMSVEDRIEIKEEVSEEQSDVDTTEDD